METGARDRFTNRYVAAVALAAAVAAFALYRTAPTVSSDSATPLAVLSALAITAEFLAFLLSASATGSIAFIPFLATALIAPNWAALCAVTAVKAVVEWRVRAPLKAAFNIAQHALTFALAVLVYRAVGGVSLQQLGDASLASATARAGGQALIAFFVSFVANTLAVSGVISVSTGRSLFVVWRETFLTTIGLDLLATPLVFVFAWVYVRFGALAAATLWVPILGLRQVHIVNLQLEQNNRELLELMVKSIEARDPYTSGHSRRVQHYAVTIARALGMREREIDRIGQAALLHDVGKIHEKYAPILRKPDRLSPDEWRVMQEHPIDGANLVATMSGLKELIPSIRHHHENWDGTGYPDGLAGELIPLPSRVIMFADTIDAMTSERPYRKPLTEEQVRAEMVRCRGRQFDPELTDRLLSSPMWSKLFAPPSSSTPATREGGLRIVRTAYGSRRASASNG